MATRWLSREQQQAWRAYLLGTTLLTDRLDRDLRETHGVSLPEYELLVRLSEAADATLRMAELADSVKNSRSRVTHTVARMEREGIVVRRQCASDGRGVLAQLTAKGRRKLESAAPDHVESVRAALIDIADPDDLAAVARVFASVVQTLTSESAHPGQSPHHTSTASRSATMVR